MVHEGRRSLKVFLCHASGDKPPVRDLYKRLTIEGVDAWLDKEKLLPGQDWRLEIPKAVQESDVVVICLSKKSVTKEGYVQKEIKFALDIAEEKPDGTIFLIPARLEDCTVPDRLSRWHWVDLYEENGFTQLLRSLKLRADAVGATVEPAHDVDTTKELNLKLEQLYTEGLAAFYTEDWDRACRRFQSILSERPNHKNASEKLEEAERQRNLSRLYEQASEAVQSGEWESAIQILEELTHTSADYKDAAQLLRNARKQEQLGELYAEAKALHAAQKWQAVVKVFEQIHTLEPNFPDAGGLLPSAQREVTEIRRIEGLNSQYSHALREMDAGHWLEARRLLEQVHKSETGFLETEKLLRKVEDATSKEEVKRRQNDEVNTLYEQAHGLLRSRKWRNALDKMSEIRKLDDRFPDADGITEKAQRELAREEQEAERQNKLAAMYAEAVRLLKEEKYQQALDKWQEVKAVDPKYPDRQWVQRTAKRKLASVGQPFVVQKDFAGAVKRMLIDDGAELTAKVGSSIASQTKAGWVILIVATSWGVMRTLIEALARVKPFFGLGINLWSIEIITGLFGLFYGVTIWLLLRYLRINIDRNRSIILMAGWLVGFLVVPVVGWNLSSFTYPWDIGYILGGLIASLSTGLVVRSLGVLPDLKQVIILMMGLTFAIYVGEQAFDVLQALEQVDQVSMDASLRFGAGSFVSGLFCVWILYNLLTRSKEKDNYTKQEWTILFMTVGWFLARFAAEWIGYNLFWDFAVDPEHPDYAIKAIVTLSLAGALSGIVLWAGIQIVVKKLTFKHLLLLTLYWAVGMTLAGLPGIIQKSGETWLWSLGLGAGSLLAVFFSMRLLHFTGIIVDKYHLVVICLIIALSFAIGNLWVGELFDNSLQYMREDIAFSVSVALQSALAGFLGMTALLGGKNENNHMRQLNWKIAIGGALGFFVSEPLYILIFGMALKDEKAFLIDSMLYGLFWGAGIMVITKKWRSILLFGLLGGLMPTSAMLFWWFLQREIFINIDIGRVLLYLVFGFFFGVIPSVGIRRSSAVLLLCFASFFSLLIEHMILPNQPDGTFIYWFGYFTRDLVLGGLIGLAWAYFLHPISILEKEKTVLTD